MGNPSVWQPAPSATDGVPNLAFLSGVQIPVPEDGITIFVANTGAGPGSGADYQLSLTSGAVVDGFNIVSTFLGGASRWLRISGAGFGGVESSFIYREGGVANGAIFVNWVDAYNAAIACGVDCFIGVDDSIAPCHVPAGTYQMGLIIIGAAVLEDSSVASVLNFDDGAHLVGLSRITRTLIVRATGTTPVITAPPGPSTNIIFDEGARMTAAAGAAPFITIPPGTSLATILRIGGTILSEAPGTQVINVDAGGLLIVGLDGLSTVDPDVFSGLGTVAYFLFSVGATFSLTQPALGAPPIVILATSSRELSYDDGAFSPSLGGVLQVQEALDVIKSSTLNFGLAAARPVASVLGGPLLVSQQFFATDVGANGTPLWWNGVAWVDANSVIVP